MQLSDRGNSVDNLCGEIFHPEKENYLDFLTAGDRLTSPPSIDPNRGAILLIEALNGSLAGPGPVNNSPHSMTVFAITSIYTDNAKR